jgi:outer membrane protein assembly factor BamB
MTRCFHARIPGRVFSLALGLVLGLTATAAARDPVAAPPGEIDPLDWPIWRGPEQNGVSRETGIVTKWDPSGENVLWQSAELGTRSTPIIMRGKLYTLARSEPATSREGEQVICADAATGKILWRNKFNVFLSDVPDTRVAWACCAGDPATGNVYAMGVCGYLQCLDGETGKTLWSRSLNEEFGLLTTYGGRTNTPIVCEDLVIISGVIIGWGEMAKPTHRFLAFDKETGQQVWFSGTRPLPDDTTYSTPVVSVLGGQKAMVFGSGDGSVWAFQPRTGVPLWQYRLSMRGLNVSPLVADGKVYMGQSEENREGNSMGALVAIDGTAAKKGEDITESGELWREKEIMVGRAGMLLLDGKLYSVDDSGNFYVNDAATGKPIGRRVKLAGTIMRSSLLYADGNIYASTVTVFHVLQPTDKGVKITQRLRFPEGEECHGSPIISHGRLYVTTTEKMYCLASKEAKTGSTPRPEEPKEMPLGKDDHTTHVQVVPVEALIKPGEKIDFAVRLYNDRGQLIEEADDATFSVEGPAQIDDGGVLTADSSAGHCALIVKAKAGGVEGIARVRVVPPLPWKFDFTNGEVPITWVGARYRNVVRDVDGNKVMVKVTNIPKGTRSQALMGPVDLHDYTIQADVLGTTKLTVVPGAPPAAAPVVAAAAPADTSEKDPPTEEPKPRAKLPDVGLIAQRYTIDLMGDHQELQIRSWTSQLERFSKSEPTPWKPNTWYTIKLRASTEGGKAVLRGKVWPRGEKEPEKWNVEATDEAGNLVGSPGLFGNSGDAEIYMDNITVTPN